MTTATMQYFKPESPEEFVSDCIPFFYGDTYYVYWLIDRGHHSSAGGLGDHKWVLSTTRDLKNWRYHGIVIGLDEPWEKSICTGSVMFADGKFHAFYATRRLAPDGGGCEQLSHAIGDDPIHFVKQKPNPFYESAPGYSTRHFRDPKAFVDADGAFNLFISTETDAPGALADSRGAIIRLRSEDRTTWHVCEPPALAGQRHVPECPDYFRIGGWHYLIYGQAGDTFYVKSRSPLGPWEYPRTQTLAEKWVNVAKTAEFPGGRRIAAGWVPERHDGKDDGWPLFGGNAIFREIVQLPDGDLATKFPDEMIPPTGDAIAAPDSGMLDAMATLDVVRIDDVPPNCRITMTLTPETNCEEYGVLLRSEADGFDGYALVFSPNAGTVRLHNTHLDDIADLREPQTLDIVLHDDLIDVCINQRRCIVNRLPEKRTGNVLRLYARLGNVRVDNIRIAPVAESGCQADLS